MYGMIMLMDNEDEPYTGWVKSETNGKLSTMGYLKNGQNMEFEATWHPNSKKESEIDWKNDQCTDLFRHGIKMEKLERSGRLPMEKLMENGRNFTKWIA